MAITCTHTLTHTHRHILSAPSRKYLLFIIQVAGESGRGGMQTILPFPPRALFMNSFQTTLSPNPEQIHVYMLLCYETTINMFFECALQMLSSSGAGDLVTVQFSHPGATADRREESVLPPRYNIIIHNNMNYYIIT